MAYFNLSVILHCILLFVTGISGTCDYGPLQRKVILGQRLPIQIDHAIMFNDRNLSITSFIKIDIKISNSENNNIMIY